LKILGIKQVTMDRQACFQFKASFSPCTILQMTRYDLDALAQQLAETVGKAPNFFLGSPVMIDLEKIKASGILNFAKIKQLLTEHGMIPVGVRGGSQEQHEAAGKDNLPVLAIGNTISKEEGKKQTETSSSYATKLITTPIRSGMHIYAKEGDLVVVASVSPGAELLADGHIHVYGPLRGRALAGVQGNKQARIFCRTLEAELVAIAGFYLTKEDMQSLPAGDAMQIYLDEDRVKIESI